jgi:TolB-like protein
VVGNARLLYTPRSFRDLMQIGNSLDVSHVVLGQVQEVGGRLRVTAHLIRLEDQSHLWARRFEFSEADAATLDLQLPAAVTEAVVSRILTPS